MRRSRHPDDHGAVGPWKQNQFTLLGRLALVTLSKDPSRRPSQISSSMAKPSLGRASWHLLMVIGVKTGEPAFDAQSRLSTWVPMAGSPAAPAAPRG